MRTPQFLRAGLLGFGWLSLAGSVADVLILSYHLALVGKGEADLFASVWDHIRDHLPALAWLRDLAGWLLPADWVAWLFGLEAVVYFPVRILFSVLTGGYALRWAARIRPRSSG